MTDSDNTELTFLLVIHSDERLGNVG